MKRALPAVGAIAVVVLLSACGPAAVQAATSTSAPAPTAAIAAATATTGPPPAPTATLNRQDAVEKAQQQLASRAFSRSGLIEELESDGFPTADATWATDQTDADWSQQAARKAKFYVGSVYFNRSSLHAQLRFDGFTEAQARYGMSQVGVTP